MIAISYLVQLWAAEWEHPLSVPCVCCISFLCSIFSTVYLVNMHPNQQIQVAAILEFYYRTKSHTFHILFASNVPHP